MSESEWLSCEQPDLMLEVVEGKVDRRHLVEFVRRCWQRVSPFLPPAQSWYAVPDEFAALAPQLSAHDAVVYADEVALRSARWAADFKEERKEQATLLRQVVPSPFAKTTTPASGRGNG